MLHTYAVTVYMYVRVQVCVFYIQCIYLQCIAISHVWCVLFATQVPILPSQTHVSTSLPVVIQRPSTV